MLILECVKKKKVQGIKWGGPLPTSSFVSRHCSGVATGGARRARSRTCAHVRAKGGLSRHTSLGSLLRQRILCRDRVG